MISVEVESLSCHILVVCCANYCFLVNIYRCVCQVQKTSLLTGDLFVCLSTDQLQRHYVGIPYHMCAFVFRRHLDCMIQPELGLWEKGKVGGVNCLFAV